ncbi:MAG: hypothetical protein NWF14_03615 [Candidatus Bathyarchaeota archaeon]|nr:hypothetical protein [Candidatus Bathyarchaeota archaeon]
MKPEKGRSEDCEEIKVLVLAHCVLNRGTRWWQKGRAVCKSRGPVRQVLEFLKARKIGAVQLPCPEFTFCGNPRPPRTKDEYGSLPGFRSHCERLAEDSAHHLQSLIVLARNPKIRVLAVVGVERSPTCGVRCTPRTVDGEIEYVEERGLFLEMLENELSSLGLEMPVMGLDMSKPADFCRRLRGLLGGASAGR